MGSYLEYRCKAEISQVVKGEGKTEITVDNRCWIRTGHTLIQVGHGGQQVTGKLGNQVIR